MTHPLWKRLNQYSDFIFNQFDEHFERWDNPSYTEDMHFKGWTDTFWHSDEVYKAHLKTIVPEDSELEAGYTKYVTNKERVRVKVSGDTHYIGVVSVGSNSATINVSVHLI